MEKCSCYDVMQYFRTDCMDNIIPTKTVSVCNGTKEREECSCGGNPAKCDFYPEKRKYTCEFYRKKDGWCTERQGPCHCPVDGDASKCTFDEQYTKAYENMLSEKSTETHVNIYDFMEKKIMNTAEMWLEAQKTGARYECVNSNIAYSKDLGLVVKDDRGISWDLLCLDGGGGGAKALDDLLSGYQWKMAEEPISISEAEKLLGRRIIVD